MFEPWTRGRKLIVSQIYVVSGDATQIYELNYRVIVTRQNNKPLSVYYNVLQASWQELDFLRTCDMECVADTAKLKKRIENGRIIEFLVGLDSDSDPIRIQILGKDPLPTLRGVYVIVRSEELRRVAMTLPMAQESLALKAVITSTHVSTVTSGNNHKPDEKDSLNCDYCNERRHTRETCFMLNGRTQWQNDNKRGGFSGGRGGGRRGRNGGPRAITQLMRRNFHLYQPILLPNHLKPKWSK
ncbi:uncharacterized protein LOC113356051 isoform X2 [Papaver somniferum]|uniref:uncharacterized protein LOC113356051 isoform X2 n=1 Tax=Papaver somniferum TaxID=3469 RepID=UPI000E6F7646|nr:uncharacterized protein LOC113356051 isoform X2 [Papaver somniferum]XP_026454846.1 uncharacterized protein LOC113356051 isoform X2 [Papaver somniferum]